LKFDEQVLMADASPLSRV